MRYNKLFFLTFSENMAAVLIKWAVRRRAAAANRPLFLEFANSSHSRNSVNIIAKISRIYAGLLYFQLHYVRNFTKQRHYNPSSDNPLSAQFLGLLRPVIKHQLTCLFYFILLSPYRASQFFITPHITRTN